MKIKIHQLCGEYLNGIQYVEHETKHDPTIELTKQELENRHSTQIAQCDVLGEDGEYYRFFFSVRVDAKGQVKAEIATNRGEKTVRKEVTGVKKDRALLPSG